MPKVQSLELKGITKVFPQVVANSDVSFSVRAGEIVGLLGENGAGKTTLMNILYGLYQPTSGSILVDGREVRFRSPADAIRAGIGMVPQHSMLVENHTVLENLVLADPSLPFLFPHRAMRRKVEAILARYGFPLDLDAFVWELSAGQRQRVEIVKALIQGSDVLILDEPTSVLTPQETQELFSVLREFAAQGHAVILISHKLEEIFQVCGRVVVLRKGRVVGEASTASIDKRELARMMVGREVVFSVDRRPVEPGGVVLEVEDLVVRGDRGETAVEGVSFTIRRHQVLGVAGVSGNGQKELVEAITGLRRPVSGVIRLKGHGVTGATPRVLHALGVGHIPEERLRFGTVPNLLIYENAVLKHHHMRPFSDVVFLNVRSMEEHARRIVDDFGVEAPSIYARTGNLSGGNIQKLILGREMSRKPDLLVASHPTYGLDVGATEYIRRQILRQRDEGAAVLLVSEDLEEILELSDLIGVMYRGRMVFLAPAEEVDVEEIGYHMAGVEARV
ncbi:ABC transporter related protein [Spirochaeta thermophila DSM 6578]|uniref:ABC transporter related protein n=1 Tax=Winmispira thermophila (strain ATCC 700085 / DSM 6578 / Z-1203) TaxID=869211 RepID=G0GDT5_WINT7|nr:ABC transporter ATP-binding protein [Spirochaeta thermophila]AEJ62215.1 ABC transporter related protein [Spirochaeta thermophila DSM 6578]